MGAEEHGHVDDVEVVVPAEPEVPKYSMQQLWDGKMTLKDFEVSGTDKPSIPHNVFEQDEALPVIDVAALLGKDKEARDDNLARMFEAAKSWGFFKIKNHGIALEVVLLPHSLTQMPHLARIIAILSSWKCVHIILLGNAR